MVNSKSKRGKLSQCKPFKPFIDQNLQLQIPEWDPQAAQNNLSHSPIYSHYVGSSPSSVSCTQVNEAEIKHAMTEAEKSYKSWKKMQKRIQEAAKNGMPM